MSNQSVNTKVQFDDLAEGSPPKFEKIEPFDPFKTSAMPRLVIAPDAPTSDTGINAIVENKAEAKGDDEMQDGASTSGESVPVAQQRDSATQAELQNLISKSKPILIVEDTAELAEVIQATLENMGLNTFIAAHGEIGLDKFKSSQCDIILLDIGLPDMTGWKFLDAIKEMRNSHQISQMPTIIVITAYDDAANRLVGKLQNIHSYLVKPFTPDRVEQLVSMALLGERPENPDFGALESPLG